MQTPHGVEMSPRATRLYTWINTQPGIRLTTFSTDQDVLMQWDALQKAKTKIDKEVKAREEFEESSQLVEFRKYSNFELFDIARDMEAIMRRLPANRVKSLTPQR